MSYELRRSDRARNVRLKVSAEEGLLVVMPHDYDPERVPPILREKAEWICRQLAYFASAPAWKPEGELEDGQTVLFEGRSLILRVRAAPEGARWSTVALSADTLSLSLRDRDRQAARRVLERWYRREARRRIEACIADLGGKSGIPSARVYVMDQRTRWGGCSRLGNLSFNWRLIMAPPGVLRYVVAHELAHLRERRHSPRFWLIVTGMVGDVEGPRRWLREHGGELRL